MSTRSRRSARLRRALLGLVTLSRDERALLALALVLLPPVSAGLRFLGLRRMLALAAAVRSVRRWDVQDDGRQATRTAWLVEVAARCLRPRPTCLAKALVVSSLLRRRGVPAQLVIGVSKASGQLQGHAWVELDGPAVGEGAGPGRYAVLARIPGGPPASVTIALHERAP